MSSRKTVGVALYFMTGMPPPRSYPSVNNEDFGSFVERLKSSGVTEWKVNKSEGKSLYFLDPDGHKLEIHDGDVESRLRACTEHPYKDIVFF